MISEVQHQHLWDSIHQTVAVVGTSVSHAVFENVTEFTDFKSWDVVFNDPSLDIEDSDEMPGDISDEEVGELVTQNNEDGDTPLGIRDENEIRDSSWKQTKANTRAILVVAIYYIIGVSFFSQIEGWDILTCVYYITITSTTVGYGDFHPTTDNSRLFAIFYFFLGIIIVLNVLGQMMEGMFDYVRVSIERGLREDPEEEKASRKRVKIEMHNLYIRNGTLIAALFITLFLGAVFFMVNESWSYLISFYFSFVTVMSIGYGDVVVTKPSSRVFLIFYTLLSMSMVTATLAGIASLKLKIATEKMKKKLFEERLDAAFISRMDLDGDATITKFEYVVVMLVKSGLINPNRHILPWVEKFDELDISGDGVLSLQDIIGAFDSSPKPKKTASINKQMNSKLESFHEAFEESLQ